MKCNKYQKWIYLYKKGELQEQENQALQEHLLSCSACAQLAKEMSVLQSETKILKKQPMLHNPDELTENIMNHIKYHSQKNTVHTRSFEKVFRYSLQFAMLLVVVFFAVQEIDTRRRMGDLEQRIRISSKSHMLAIKNPLLHADDVTIDKELLLNLLNENMLLRMEFKKLRDELRKQGLEIDSTLLENKELLKLFSDPHVIEKLIEL